MVGVRALSVPCRYPRVRIHIPLTTNSEVTFLCGQHGEEMPLHMKVGHTYVLNNHLAHAVKNGGTTPRIHLTVDLIGSRRFWGQMQGIRSSSELWKPAEKACAAPPARYKDSPVVLEGWDDQTLAVPRSSRCPVAAAVVATVSKILSAGDRKQLRALLLKWCDFIQGKRMGYEAEVELLQSLVAEWECRLGTNEERPVQVRDVIDAVVEVYNLPLRENRFRVVGSTTA